MKLKDWKRLLDPSQHVYSRAQRDPFMPTRRGGRPFKQIPAMRAEVRQRLLDGLVIRRDEMARNYMTNRTAVERAQLVEMGRIAGERGALYAIALAFEAGKLAERSRQRKAQKKSLPFNQPPWKETAMASFLTYKIPNNPMTFHLAVAEAHDAPDPNGISVKELIPENLPVETIFVGSDKRKHLHVICNIEPQIGRLLLRSDPEPPEADVAAATAEVKRVLDYLTSPDFTATVREVLRR